MNSIKWNTGKSIQKIMEKNDVKMVFIMKMIIECLYFCYRSAFSAKYNTFECRPSSLSISLSLSLPLGRTKTFTSRGLSLSGRHFLSLVPGFLHQRSFGIHMISSNPWIMEYVLYWKDPSRNKSVKITQKSTSSNIKWNIFLDIFTLPSLLHILNQSSPTCTMYSVHLQHTNLYLSKPNVLFIRIRVLSEANSIQC